MISGVEIPGYDVIRPLGSGGMSTVYLAVQRSLDRKVAIKVMRRSLEAADTRQLEKRFLLEGRMMAKLPHRNIVAVYDIVSNDTLAYIAMEYLSGGSLTDRMRNGLSLAEAVAVVVQIAGALEHAHSQNVVHRDLKPANIMFRDNGTPVLTDFGIARYQDVSATKLTQTGMLVGTPTYMSPEQINAENSDGRSDLYSLGILFYELLTGRPPFRGETPIAVLMAHLTQQPPPLPDELSLFQEIIDRMLAKNRDDRFANMREFSQYLRARFVESETLQMRLRVDPNATTSEQLRALGFSSGSGESLRTSFPTLPKPAAPVPPIPPPVAATAAPDKRDRRFRLAIGAIAAVLILLAGAWAYRNTHMRLNRDEQELVALWLRQANSYVAEGKLVTPADENAFAYVQKTLQKDPQNEAAQALLTSITQTLADLAGKELVAGRLDAALEAASQGLLVHPDDKALAQVKAQIEQAQKAQKRKQQVDALIAQAQRAGAEQHIGGADGAYALLEQARALTPDDHALAERLEAVVQLALSPSRKLLQDGQAASAQAALEKLGPELSSEPAYLELKTQIEAAGRQQQLGKQIAALLEQGTRALRDGHLDEPASDNASATLGELMKLGGDDKRVADFASALARAYLDDARKLDAKGQSARALDRVTSALRIAPQLGDAQQLKSRIEQRLGERATRIAQAIGAIRQAIADQRFTPPATNDAFTGLTALAQLDPENADAKQLSAELPRRIADAVAARASSDANAAAALLKSARQVYPQDAALTQLSAKLDAQIAAEREAAQLQGTRDLVAKILGARTRSPADWRKAAQAIGSLAAAGDKSAPLLRKQFVELLGEQLRAAATTPDFDALAKVLADEESVLSAEPTYAALKQSAPGQRSKLIEAERALAAAQAGELVLNAYPWGSVESVVDANRQPVALPANVTTPLVLSLPAGNYVVTFRHPQVDKAAQVIAKVEPKKRASANATFPTLSAQDYFARAGWK